MPEQRSRTAATGPPETETPALARTGALTRTHTTATTPRNNNSTAAARHNQDADILGLRRRRAAAQRSAILDTCGHGGHADPWACRCRRPEPPLTDNQIDGWADCARYIRETTGHTPLLPAAVLAALWRRGGDDRALAEQIHAAGGTAA
jgi:hypothetical protein